MEACPGTLPHHALWFVEPSRSTRVRVCWCDLPRPRGWDAHRSALSVTCLVHPNNLCQKYHVYRTPLFSTYGLQDASAIRPRSASYDRSSVHPFAVNLVGAACAALPAFCLSGFDRVGSLIILSMTVAFLRVQCRLFSFFNSSSKRADVHDSVAKGNLPSETSASQINPEWL